MSGSEVGICAEGKGRKTITPNLKTWAYLGFVRSTDQVIGEYPWQKWVNPSLRSHPTKKQEGLAEE